MWREHGLVKYERIEKDAISYLPENVSTFSLYQHNITTKQNET